VLSRASRQPLKCVSWPEFRCAFTRCPFIAPASSIRQVLGAWVRAWGFGAGAVCLASPWSLGWCPSGPPDSCSTSGCACLCTERPSCCLQSARQVLWAASHSSHMHMPVLYVFKMASCLACAIVGLAPQSEHLLRKSALCATCKQH